MELKLEKTSFKEDEEVEKLVNSGKKVDEAKVEKTLNYDTLTKKKKLLINLIAKSMFLMALKYYNLVHLRKKKYQNFLIIS